MCSVREIPSVVTRWAETPKTLEYLGGVDEYRRGDADVTDALALNPFGGDASLTGGVVMPSSVVLRG